MDKLEKFWEDEIRRDERLLSHSLDIMHREIQELPRDTVDGEPLALPKVFSTEEINKFDQIVKMSHAICCKVIQHFQEDPSYRMLFPFSQSMEEAILVDPHYDALLPIARFDIFYNEDTGDFKFCEINTDGTSAMLETASWDMLFQRTPLAKALSMYCDENDLTLKRFELFEHWIDTFLSIYRTWPNAKEAPNIAITDFMEIGTVREFEEYASRFQARGLHARVVDLRDMVYENGQLSTKDGFPIDAVYRRAVTSEIIDRAEDAAAFLAAAADNAVFVCGALRTQIPHCKPFFEILFLPETMAILSEEEQEFVRKHIPYTIRLGSGGMSISEASKEKDSRILKPYDSFGAHGVIAGRDVSQAEWEKLLEKDYDQGYVMQEFVIPYETKNIASQGEWQDYMNLTGLYSFNGVFSGIYSRYSRHTIITTHNNGHSTATYYV